MDIKNREEALLAPPTPKYKLKAFERRMDKLRIHKLEDFLEFLYDEKCEGVYDPYTGFNTMVKEYNDKGKFPWSKMQYIGDPLESDFQFKKNARSREMVIVDKINILPQRFHCRVYLNESEIVIVSETEINPEDLGTGVVHILEGKGRLKNHPKPEHRIIRIQLRKRTWIQRRFTKRYR